MRLLAATGLDGAIVLTFDEALANLSAEDFVARILVERFAVGGAAIGFNFHFGMHRAGSPDFLVARRQESTALPSTSCRASRITAVRYHRGPIREALAAGKLDEAAEFLGYPWFLSGTVIHGDKRGRELGFPTANLKPDPACGLRHGIYAVRAAVGGRRYDGVASFGRRPMFDAGTVLLEIFLFDFSGDLYGADHGCRLYRLAPRREAMFASAEELMRQMQEDAGWRGKRLARAARCVSADLRLRPVAVAMFARPLRRHEAKQRDRHHALPADSAAGLHGDAENFRIEQPRRRMRLRRAGENGALADAAADQRTDDAATRAITTNMPAMIRPAKTLPNWTANQS